MEKLYKLIVLFVGLTVMNLTIQAQSFPYAPHSLVAVKYTSVNSWNAVLTPYLAKQSVDFINYPNPASTFTTVGYTLTSRSNVTLRVIDLAGKQLAVLIKQQQNAGKQEFYWELAKNNITSGMYILILQIDNKSYSRKIIVQ